METLRTPLAKARLLADRPAFSASPSLRPPPVSSSRCSLRRQRLAFRCEAQAAQHAVVLGGLGLRGLMLSQTAMTEQQQALRDELLRELDALEEEKRNGKPTPEVQTILDKLKEAADAGGGIQVDTAKVDGVFTSVLDSAIVIQRGVTLGSMTFQQFGPREQPVTLVPGGDGLYQGEEAPSQYAVRTMFKVADGKHEGLLGMWSVEGHYSTDAATDGRQLINFTDVRLEPADSSPKALAAWLDLTKASNPGMDDKGVITNKFEKPIRGHRDFIYLDDNCQVTIGNRGGYVAVVRK